MGPPREQGIRDPSDNFLGTPNGANGEPKAPQRGQNDANGEVPERRQAARREEILYMQGRNIWTVVPRQLSWDLTGKGPVSVRWVEPEEKPDRSRLVARDFKGDDKGRDDLFAETPPLEAKRMLLSKAATRREDGKPRKLLFIDAKKAHLNPRCEDEVYVELPREYGVPEVSVLS